MAASTLLNSWALLCSMALLVTPVRSGADGTDVDDAGPTDVAAVLEEVEAQECVRPIDPPRMPFGAKDRCPSYPGSSGIARGDFNGDGIADLAIGAPGEDLPGVLQAPLNDAGAVHVIYGTVASGLVAVAATVPTTQILAQPTAPAPLGTNVREANDGFGTALAAGDFNDDGFSDLAVGVPGERISGTTAFGIVQIFQGSAAGLSPSPVRNFGPTLFTFPGVVSPDFSRGPTSLSWGDFNGDGFGDLAVAAQFIDVNDGLTPATGTATVLFGSSTGLSSTGFQQFFSATFIGDGTQNTPLILAAGDFNADGFSELVTGAPTRTIGNALLAGGVSVLRGTATGLTLVGQQNLSANTANVPGAAEIGDLLGQAVAVGDFNGDTFADLAIGAPGKRVNGTISGSVIVIHGSNQGLQAPANGALVSQLWTQNSSAVFGSAEGGDQFGLALASSDFNGDGFKDLAIGAPTEDLAAGADVGVINILYGSAAGLSLTLARAPQAFDQSAFSTTGIEAGDRFGTTLTAWNFGRTAQGDLAIGVPFEDVGTIVDAGTVNVLYGTLNGLVTTGRQSWTQNSANVPDAAEAGDRFGQAAY